MSYTDWMIRTKQIGACSCNYGCPGELNEFDLERRRGRFFVENVLKADVEPIRNPVTGEDHHIAIRPHRGFEFREAETASASFWSKGKLDQEHDGRSAAMSFVSHGPYGVVPEESFPGRSD